MFALNLKSQFTFLRIVLILGGIIALAHPQDATIPPRLTIWYSDNLNAKAGSDILLSAHYGFSKLEDTYLPINLWNEMGWVEKTGGISYRLLRLNFVELSLLTFFTALPQHEVFGHGYRAREFGFKNINYAFSPPWPYGEGMARTNFKYSKLNYTPDKELALSSGGVEASAIMAGKLRSYGFQSGKWDYHRALLYTVAAGDLGNYLNQTQEKDLESNPDLSNDMLNYIQVLNEKAGRSQRHNFKLHLNQLRKRSKIALFDPFLWFSYWTIFKTHLWSGYSEFSLPSLPLGAVNYLPLLGYGLTPWGPEYQLENLVRWNRTVLCLRIRIGDDTFRKFWGMDVETMNLFSLLGSDIDLGLHIWREPRLRLDINDHKIIPLQYGGSGSIDFFSPDLGLVFPLRLAGGIDYKSSGFLPGAILDEGLTWRFGLDIPL